MMEVDASMKRTTAKAPGRTLKEEKHLYPRYRNPSQLQGPAKGFHERACKLSGLKMTTILKAVITIERRIEEWAKERNREERERQNVYGGDFAPTGDQVSE